MRNGSSVADKQCIKSVAGIGGFPLHLSVLVLLYSKASHHFEIHSNSYLALISSI